MSKYYFQTKILDEFRKPYELCFSKNKSNGVLNDHFMEYDFTVMFFNLEKNIMNVVVDNKGYMLNFPGIKMGDWQKKAKSTEYLKGLNEYGMAFKELEDGHFMIIWTIQMKDGNNEMIQLYALVDDEGNYLDKFDLYYM